MRVLSRDGAVVTSLPAATAGGELKRPEAMAWRASDGAIAVYDRDDDEIQILSSEGAFQQRVGRQGTGPGEISKATSMTFDLAGHLFVVDLEGSRLQEFDEHGIYLRGSPPVTINRAAGNVALGVGADALGTHVRPRSRPPAPPRRSARTASSARSDLRGSRARSRGSP